MKTYKQFNEAVSAIRLAQLALKGKGGAAAAKMAADGLKAGSKLAPKTKALPGKASSALTKVKPPGGKPPSGAPPKALPGTSSSALTKVKPPGGKPPSGDPPKALPGTSSSALTKVKPTSGDIMKAKRPPSRAKPDGPNQFADTNMRRKLQKGAGNLAKRGLSAVGKGAMSALTTPTPRGTAQSATGDGAPDVVVK